MYHHDAYLFRHDFPLNLLVRILPLRPFPTSPFRRLDYVNIARSSRPRFSLHA
jgi:hypothetical protein